MTVQMPELQEEQMRLAVGTFIEYFSHLEWHAHSWVISLIEDKEQGRKWADMLFAPRVRKLIELSRTGIEPELRDEWIELWQAALDLVEHRNNIVHNPPAAFLRVRFDGASESAYALHLYKDGSGPEGMPHYTTAQIREYAEQAKGLWHHVVAFIGKWHAVRGTLSRPPSAPA